jgi:hypothetical protein
MSSQLHVLFTYQEYITGNKNFPSLLYEIFMSIFDDK